MSAFTDREFGPGEVVTLDGNEFTRCTFNGCQVVFAGGAVSVNSCNFSDPQMVFVGAAEQTVRFLRAFGSIRGAERFLDAVVRQLRGEQEFMQADKRGIGGVTLH
ncbi:hypothetical protein GIY62_14690 [Burkholderia plantarii]|uniref:hypothetical protein n=1 Tax=Burkholderia plantarii TaxID=41899 RepID=UPI00272CAB3A|nr:hypothetical protein [Burkholderia plantarii]WLE58374.1 hypothetical protein GIY62_14690 [Burkholderia plantarii]